MTTDSSSDQPWLLFRVDGDMDAGVDARALANLLTDIVSAARYIAREKLSLGNPRGPMSAQERALAGLRVTSVSPGSVNIAFAAPPTVTEPQSVILSDEQMTPAAIARELIQEFESAFSPRSSLGQDYGRRRAVERIARTAARIGNSVEIVHHSPDAEEIRVRVPLTSDAARYEAPVPLIRQRVMFGQVFMADVEDGRQRVRVKLADDSDLTMPLEEDAAGVMPHVLGQLAELHVSEALVGGTVIERVVGAVRLLTPDQRGIDVPPKSIDELAAEQGLSFLPPPDYVSILSGLWESEEEAEAFRADIRNGRAAI